jgi:hypothetical protein
MYSKEMGTFSSKKEMGTLKATQPSLVLKKNLKKKKKKIQPLS